MKVEHYARYYIPSLLWAGESSRQLKERSPEEALAQMPPEAFGFRLYDVEVLVGVLENGEPVESRKVKRESEMYYPGGQKFTAAQVAKLDDSDYDILKSNTRANKYKALVKTRMGNWQPLEEGDIIL